MHPLIICQLAHRCSKHSQNFPYNDALQRNWNAKLEPSRSRKLKPQSDFHTFHEEHGTFSLLAAIIASCIAVTGIGAFHVLTTLQKQEQTQIHMDRCTGKLSLDLREVVTTVDASNKRMKAYYSALSAAVVLPSVIEAIRTALNLEHDFQEIIKLKWIEKQESWILGKENECESIHGAVFVPIPDFPYEEGGQSVFGPLPSHWMGERYIKIRLIDRPLVSVAQIFKQNGWKVAWISAKNL